MENTAVAALFEPLLGAQRCLTDDASAAQYGTDWTKF